MNDLSGEGGHFGDYHDPSFMGATLSLRPEDLDRLDASQYGEDDFMDTHTQGHHNTGPYHQHHQAGFDERSLYAKVDQSIQRSLDRWDEERRVQNPPITNPSYDHTGNSMTPGPPPLQYQKILTPPSSRPTPGAMIKPATITGAATTTGMARTDLGDPLIPRLSVDREATLTQMQYTFDQRLEALRREEDGRRRQLEATHQEQMNKLNRDVDTMIVQHQQVLKLKNEVERGLQKELELARKELTREKDERQTDLNRYHKTVRELHKRIAGLERKLEESRRMARGNARCVSFDDDDDDEEGKVAGRLGTQMAWGRNAYAERVQALRRDYDSKISNLVRQFEREKAATIEILKSKVKAEVNLLFPRLRDQFQRAYTEKISTLKSRLATQLREQYESRLRHIKEEHSVERRVWQRQMRERIEKERTELTQRLRAKYEIKVLDIQNECERRILERLRGESSSGSALASMSGNSKKKTFYEDSFLEVDNEDSFNLNDSFSLIS